MWYRLLKPPTITSTLSFLDQNAYEIDRLFGITAGVVVNRFHLPAVDAAGVDLFEIHLQGLQFRSREERAGPVTARKVPMMMVSPADVCAAARLNNNPAANIETDLRIFMLIVTLSNFHLNTAFD